MRKAVCAVLLLVLLDFVTKYWAMQTLSLGVPVTVWPWFNWALSYNPGAAFSFLADQNGWQRWFFIGLSLLAIVAFAFYYYRLEARERIARCGVILLLGGAIGNLIDRICRGEVVDFIQWHVGGYYWPSFNLADSAITLGVVLLLWDAVRAVRSSHA